MQEFTGIRSPLENLQEISKQIQGWRQLGFKFSVELTDKHPTTCTGFHSTLCTATAHLRSGQT
jgi:hypothetical protein